MVEKDSNPQATSPVNGNLNGNGVISSKPKSHIGLLKETPAQWTMGDAFTARAKHHESIKALWETKWKVPVRIGLSI